MKADAIALILLIFLAGCSAEAGNEQEKNEIECPNGFLNDPYPGSCRVFTDNDNNGICDLSE